MNLDDQNSLRFITQAKTTFKNQSSYLRLLDDIFLLCSGLESLGGHGHDITFMHHYTLLKTTYFNS